MKLKIDQQLKIHGVRARWRDRAMARKVKQKPAGRKKMEREVRNTQRTRTREIRMGNQMRLVFLFACSSHLLFVNLEFV